MILSDKEIKGIKYRAFGDHFCFEYGLPSGEADDLKDSHLEANARNRELDAEAQEWYERYVICCEDSRLERETLRNKLDETNAKLRELYGYLLQADKDGESNIPQEIGNEIEEILR